MGTRVPTDAAGLRQRAEERLKADEPERAPQISAAEDTRLLHELEVYQVELELQNEELRAARAELEEGLARYTELFDFAPIGYVTLAANGTIHESNHAAAKLLGKARARLVGFPFNAFVVPSQQAAFNSLLHRASSSETRETCELELSVTRGIPIHVRLGATLLSRSKLFLLAFEDITDSKVREQQLAETERALLEAQRRKDEFLSTLSHELRNPLAPIRNSLHVLNRVEPGAALARRALAVIDRQVAHLTHLVDDLLDVTRIARGKIQLKLERVDLGELLRRTLEDHRSGFEASGVRLEGRFDTGPLWVDGDATRLIQVLTNLLGNAEKFTPLGGTVVASLLRVGTKASLEVQDTGVGITRDMLEHLFEPFTQAPQTMDRSRGGLGLGLAMVKGLVELHGGQVSIKSAGLHRGTTITVLLPLAEAPAQVEVARP